jgi:hypothetical protein
MNSKEKEQGIKKESTIKKFMEVILLWKKLKTVFGLPIFLNVITDKWGYSLLDKFFNYYKVVCFLELVHCLLPTNFKLKIFPDLIEKFQK